MDNLNVDWSSGWILSCFFGCEGKIHKPKPWINQACKEIHTATLGMKVTSVVCKLEIKINLSKSKVKLHAYSKSISTTKFVISPLLKINMHHQMWNRAPTPNQYAPPNVESRPYYKSISTTKCVISPLFKINMHQEMLNRAPTPNQSSPTARTCTRGLQHVNWVCGPLHHQSLTLSS